MTNGVMNRASQAHPLGFLPLCEIQQLIGMENIERLSYCTGE